MERAKKPRVIELVQCLGLAIPLSAVGKLARELRHHDTDEDIPLNNVPKAVLNYISSIETPFGALVKHLQLPLQEGGYLDWPICCPFALLYFMCGKSFAFGTLLRNHITSGVANIVVWADETTSGNQLRADMKRTFLSLYWSIADLPDFFKCSDHGWWPIGILSHDSTKSVAGEVSGIMKHVLRFMFMGQNNFATGIVLNLCGATTTIKGRLAAVLQDEKGHKQVGSVKGAAGTKCCLMCKNVVSTDISKVQNDSYCVHVTSPDVSKFILHDDASFWEMCDELVERSTTQRPTEFALSQQIFGVRYDKDALPFDVPLRRFYKPVSSVYWDWMHVYLTSSGVMQYHMNEMCLDIQEHTTLTMAALDGMMNRFIAFNKSQLRSLGEHFLEGHVVQTRGKHMKGFAGDMVTVLCFLFWFCTRYLLPEGKLVEQCRAISLAHEIIALLRTGDAAVRKSDELRNLNNATIGHCGICTPSAY